MQTFLPFADFQSSAKVLDCQRLGKQRLEAFQILRTLAGYTSGWKNHPAVKMWSGYEFQLGQYGFYVCREWILRGYKDTVTEKVLDVVSEFPKSEFPFWFGDEAFHRAHQSNLIRKDPKRYGPLFPGVPDDLSYIWPVR